MPEHDISSAVKNLQAALRHAEAERDAAVKSEKAKDAFLARVNHDIRSPMNAIAGLANILAISRPLTEKQKKMIETLQLSADSLLSLLNDLGAQMLGGMREGPSELSEASESDATEKAGHILLIEDYVPNVLVATSFLDEFGYSYDVANNGCEAIEKMKQGVYDAALMDVQMREMNGFETTGAIRDYEKMQQKKRLPIIGMTAHALDGDKDRCLASGMDDYIAKPFYADDLKKKLASVIQK